MTAHRGLTPPEHQAEFKPRWSPERFADAFETLAVASGGIEHLRALALALGMRGLLETAHASDEPAHRLVARLAQARKRLVESGAARRIGPSDDGELELPFAPPSGWAWTRLGEVMTVVRGASPRPKGDPKFFSPSRTAFPWVKISDFRKHGDGKTLLDTDEFLTAEGATRSVLAPKGTLILTNSATIGVPMFMGIDGYIHDGFLAFPHFPAEIDQQFFFLQLRFLTRHMKSEARGLAQLNLNSDIVRCSPLILPPFAEQKRIVARVDQLMALIDELEAKQTRKREVGARFTKASLEALTSAEGPDEFDAAWKRVVENWETVIDRSEKVGGLRQSILRLAVTRGMQGAGRGAWLSRTLGDVASFLNGYAFKSEWFTATGVRLLRNVNVSHGKLDWTVTARIASDRNREFARFALCAGDIVVSLDRPLISTGVKVARVVKADLPCLLLQRVARVSPIPGLMDAEYLFLWLTSPAFTDAIDPGRSNGVPHISTREMQALPMALPPLEEQKRIVAKVEQLMKVCDELEAKLRRAEDRAAKLVEAVVLEMVG